MTSEAVVERPQPIISMLRTDFIGVLVLGGVAGVLIWLLGTVLNQFVFEAYLCQGAEVARQCDNAKNYAVVIASLVGAVAALAGLIRLRVYRPLLVVIASLVSTWGVVQLSWGIQWFFGMFIVIALYALAFGVFSWIARIREFWITVLIMIILVVAVRLALAA